MITLYSLRLKTFVFEFTAETQSSQRKTALSYLRNLCGLCVSAVRNVAFQAYSV
jgi:hypothetical protein